MTNLYIACLLGKIGKTSTTRWPSILLNRRLEKKAAELVLPNLDFIFQLQLWKLNLDFVLNCILNCS
ncbi:hypothetical protein RchiOBHm_Chr2g0137931 [Rosa chinensis]|uniref:Uncharacterized protein n=1 Tax=Rosa chinensis TaxID=74649 RepID=A0A2P6RWS0_ROSCH|nr:hypothetical protein RchiOBHm_Chr2g0137931 [Rosa chinensis]